MEGTSGMLVQTENMMKEMGIWVSGGGEGPGREEEMG